MISYRASASCVPLSRFFKEEEMGGDTSSNGSFIPIPNLSFVSLSPLRDNRTEQMHPQVHSELSPVVSSFRLFSSHQDVLNAITDLEQTGLHKYSVEDVQDRHKILFPDGQSPESVGVRLRELCSHNFLQKEHAGKRVIYWRIR